MLVYISVTYISYHVSQHIHPNKIKQIFCYVKGDLTFPSTANTNLKANWSYPLNINERTTSKLTDKYCFLRVFWLSSSASSQNPYSDKLKAVARSL